MSAISSKHSYASYAYWLECSLSLHTGGLMGGEVTYKISAANA